MRKRLRWVRWLKSLFTCVIVVEVLFIVCLVIIGARNNWWPKELPKMSIRLNDVTLSEINSDNKNTKYYGNTVSLVDKESEFEWYNVEIKGRGNYTWGDVKKPYRIKFQDKVNLFGLGESKKWVLLTNNFDDSLLRNALGLFVAKMVGEDYVSDGKFVRLDVDGQDLGVYYVVTPVEISKLSVPLKDQYGVLMELDNLNCEQEEWYKKTNSGSCLTIKDVVNEDNAEVAMELFVDDYNKLEKAARNKDYNTVKKMIDVKSFVEYYLISELSVNPDAYVTSFYFYKDGEDDKIHAGPAWDFDSAFSNLNLGSGSLEEEILDPRVDNAKRDYAFGWEYYDEEKEKIVKVEPNENISKLMYYLIEIPEFREEVIQMYQEKLSGKRNELVKFIRDNAAEIRNDALADTAMWNKNDFDEAVGYLEWWVEQRINHMDIVYGGASEMPWIMERVE